MKALSMWQPWASLVAMGAKKIDTRCWDTKYRGLLAIHSTATIKQWMGTSRFTPLFQEHLRLAMGTSNCSDTARAVLSLPRGAVLCIVNLVAIEETRFAREGLSERELAFGNYTDGRYAWHLELLEVFSEPVPAKGNRMLWDWKQQRAMGATA